jgi:hypothetical protein
MKALIEGTTKPADPAVTSVAKQENGKEQTMSVPHEPIPVPLPPGRIPEPPIKEPEPDVLPDELPNPNPDENDAPAKHVLTC